MRTLAPAERRAFRARAHSLHPVVAIGHNGLTPAVLHEIDVNLLAHELIKIRVFGDDRDEREALLARICTDLDAAPVQHLGKILTIWRPAPPAEPQSAERQSDRTERPRKQGRTKKNASDKLPSQRNGGVKRAPRRGRSVIVEAPVEGNLRRRLARGADAKAQSPQGHAPQGKSAAPRVRSAGSRRRRRP